MAGSSHGHGHTPAAWTGAGVVGAARAWAKSASRGARALWRVAAAAVAMLSAWACGL